MTDTNKIFDGLLVLQYRAGNQKALNLLVNRHHLRLCKHSYWYTHDMDAAKDIVQDCWGAIINKLGSLRDPNLFGSWALRIVTRKSLDFVNRRRKEVERLKEFQKPDDFDDKNDNYEDKISKLQKAIGHLPNSQQIVLRLFYTEDYSLREISSTLEISIGTVKSRLFHAREKLKSILKK